ncbi:MAG: hypothetical protein WCI59_17975 [Betaproteobacteria bacterium]
MAVAGGTHLWHHRHDRRDPNALTSLMEDLHPERKKLWYRVRARLLAPVLTVIAMVLFWPVAWWMRCAELLNERRVARQREEEVFKVKPQHLLERLTVDEIEAREMVQDPLNAVPKLAFGHLNAAWSQLKSAMQPGDELWSFSATWPGSFGLPELRKGYVLWRRRKPVGHVLTMCKELALVLPELPQPRQAAGQAGQRTELPSDEIEIPAFLRKQAD